MAKGAERRATAPVLSPDAPPLTWDQVKEALGHWYWAELFLACQGNVSEAARIANVNRNHVYKLFRRFGVRMPRRYFAGRGREQRHPRDLDAFRRAVGLDVGTDPLYCRKSAAVAAAVPEEG